MSTTNHSVADGPVQHNFQTNLPNGELTLVSRLATVAAVGVAVALIEIELIPGMLIGVTAVMAPKLFPRIGNALRPMVKGALRAGYVLAERTKATMAEASEKIQDITAEVRAEHDPLPVSTIHHEPAAHTPPAPEHPRESVKGKRARS